MATIPASLRQFVIERANNRCEYCGISQTGQVATFHIDHIVPIVAGGETSVENLALACVSCSLRKGSRQELKDVETNETVSVFHPRQQPWKEILPGMELRSLD
jgi:5-methylcytosine-specific restriction endonuclease McrA